MIVVLLSQLLGDLFAVKESSTHKKTVAASYEKGTAHNKKVLHKTKGLPCGTQGLFTKRTNIHWHFRLTRVGAFDNLPVSIDIGLRFVLILILG